MGHWQLFELSYQGHNILIQFSKGQFKATIVLRNSNSTTLLIVIACVHRIQMRVDKRLALKGEFDKDQELSDKERDLDPEISVGGNKNRDLIS